ncbi:hypothetical protein [Streptococcus sp. V913]
MRFNDTTSEGNQLHLEGYAIWKESVIEFKLTEKTQVNVGLSVTADAGAWGTTDDWNLKKSMQPKIPKPHRNKLKLMIAMKES